MPARITRLAPSPTGALHLGNARTFLVNWLLARQNGWRVELRIEDIDGPRLKRGADRQLLEDLRWLGLEADGAAVYQSARLQLYQQALETLIQRRQAYPCYCTRGDIERAASAPHAEDGASVYPGTCRRRYFASDTPPPAGPPCAWRMALPGGELTWRDQFAGPQSARAEELGDFVLAKRDGLPAYQLAVVVDDALMSITDVVRGDDLLSSTPRQMWIYRALGWEDKIPRYWHLPLVLGPDGRRLAKRHGDSRLSTYRAAGVKASTILKLLARWCGMETGEPIGGATDLLSRFDLGRLPKTPIVFDGQLPQ